MYIPIICILIGMVLAMALRKRAVVVAIMACAVIIILLMNLDKILKLAEAVRRLADVGHFLGAW